MVGAGMSKFDIFSDKDSKDLFAEAFVEMNTSVDKGLDPADIDALISRQFHERFFRPPISLGGNSFRFSRTRSQTGNANRRRLCFKRTCFPRRRFCNSIRILRCSLGWRR